MSRNRCLGKKLIQQKNEADQLIAKLKTDIISGYKLVTTIVKYETDELVNTEIKSNNRVKIGLKRGIVG